MIPRTVHWKNALATAVRDPAELLALLGLSAELLPAAKSAARNFPLRVPRGFIARMQPGDPADPLLRQVLPLDAELRDIAGFDADPVGDAAALAGPGVLHKYHGRALLVTTGACAINCRYCFRRHFPYSEENAARDGWQAAIDYLETRPEVSELILSGGDPLLLDDAKLNGLTSQLEALPHITTLRLHTRLPVVLPERVDDGLLEWLAGNHLKSVVVIHANHPAELDHSVADALAKLHQAGVTLLNQSVLLSGINDSAHTLIALSQRLFQLGVMPYYLHLLDRVSGAAHFEVDEENAGILLTQLREQLPGYLVPQLVREQAGAPFKLPQT